MNRAFDAWVGAMLRHRIAVLIFTAAVTGLLAWVISGLPLMTTIRDMLPDDSVELAAYDEARQRFGGDETVLVALERDDHFTTAGLARIAAVTEAYKTHPLVDQVDSLTGADWLRAADRELLIDPFYDPDDPRDPALVRAQVLTDPLISGNLVSKDGRYALIVLRLIPSDRDMLDREEVAEYLDTHEARVPGGRKQLALDGGGRRVVEVLKQRMMPEVRQLARDAGFTDPQIHLTGFPAVLGLLLTESEFAIKVLLPVTALVIALVLLITLRRVVDVLLPLICVLPAVVWAIGIGGLVFERLTIMTAVAPIMVLVVGMSDVVHLVTQYRHELSRGLARDDAIRVAFREVGSACVLTSLTTLIGFGSMLFLPLPHSRELGFFAGMGVVTAFVLAFTLTPVLLSFTNATPAAAPKKFFLTRFLAGLADWIAPRTRPIIAVGALVTASTLALVSTVKVENHLIQKFPAGHAMRVATDKVSEAMGGTSEVEVRIDTGRPDGVKDPAVLAAMWKMQREIEAIETVAQTRSLIDVMGRMHALMAPELAARDPLPNTPAMIAQYLLLFDMSGGRNLDQLVDPTGQHLRMMVRTSSLTAEEAIASAEEVDAVAARLLPEGCTGTAGGLGVMTARAGPEIQRVSLRGLAVALVLIAILMGVLFGSLRVALLSIIPNLFPVAFGVVCVMLFTPPVDADIMIFLTICIGIAVDDTIHFLARFRLERARGRDRVAAIHATLVESGHGILRTSIILALGFSVPGFSAYHGLRAMGVMLPATFLAAVVLDLTMVPAMAQRGWLEPRKRRDA